MSVELIRLKKSHMGGMKDEVNELHPLLKQVLGKMENIQHVEYTHGPNEKGADFVLEKYDPTLAETYCVGVVAKLGKIHLDLADIERQIDECSMPRYIRNGTKQVYLNEVWVIVTDNVTNNAREKIHYKFASAKIHFIDGDRLINLIDQHAPYYWYSIPTELGDYFLHLWTKNEEVDRQSSLLTAKNEKFYIPLDLIKLEDGSYGKKKHPKSVEIESAIEANQIVIVEGEMGSGKSRLLRKVIETYSTPQSYSKNKLIPLFVSFPSLIKDYRCDIQRCIEVQLGAAKDVAEKKGAVYLLLVDGIDEAIDDSGKGGFDHLKNIVGNIKQATNVRAIFTTRPLKKIEQEAELRRLVAQYAIQPLSTTKIKEFVEKICTEVNVSKRLIEDIKKSQLFKQLPRSPIAAILLSRLLTENAKELPSNLTELYSKSLELMLGRWDIDKGLFSQKEYEASERVCCMLASYMLENGLTQVSSGEVKEMFKRYLDERNLDIDSDKLYEKVVVRSGVLSRDLDNKTVFFRHRSFAEYLYAKDLLRSKKLAVDQRVFDIYWINTCFFYVGLQRDCLDLLKEILQYPVTTDSEKWLKIFNAPNYLLAGFSSPYKIVEDSLHALFIEAARLYLEIRSGKTKAIKLSQMPEMHLLWVVQYLIRESYSYEFFERAVEQAALQIDSSIESDEVKAYALFFLAVVALDLGQKEPFQFLLDEIGSERLPLPISCALVCEMSFHKNLEHSQLMKKHRKKLKRIINGNRGLREAVSAMFEEPPKAITG